MYYEFYIDQFFLEHFLTGGLLIALAAGLRKKKLSAKRLAAASAAGAAAASLTICAGIPCWYIPGLFFAGLLAFPDRDWRALAGSLAALLFVTACFGGVLEAVVELTGVPLAAGSIAAAVLLRCAWGRYRTHDSERITSVRVRICWQEKSVTVQGLLDTGNQLREPVTRRPVSVLEEEAARELLGGGWEEKRGFYLIPYHTIGRETGWMRAVTVDKMYLETPEKTVETDQPILAVCRGRVSVRGQYQIILHPLHAEGRNQK